MQEEPPPVEPVIDGNDVVSTFFDGLANSFVDWWYVWLMLLVLIVAAAWLSGWAERSRR